MRRLLALAFASLLVASGASAQNAGADFAQRLRDAFANIRADVVNGGGRITMAGNLGNAPTLMEPTDLGLVVVAGGRLALYDPLTLAPLGKVDLFADAAADDVARRQPAAVIPLGKYLLVVVGDQFFRVDLGKMKVEVRAALDPPPAAGAPANRVFIIGGATPILRLEGANLYVLRGASVVAVEAKEGKILARTDLPEEMAAGVRIDLRDFAAFPGGPFGAPGGPAALPPAAAVDMTVVGVLVNHAELEGGFWTVRTDARDEYILAGDKLADLLAIPQIEGKRVRITGSCAVGANIQMFGKGTLTIAAFQVMP